MDVQSTTEQEFVNLDYLIYSSHKTGTQSLVQTLKSNGFQALHCHTIKNLGLKRGELKRYLEEYFDQNKKPLEVISVFREPLERHVSSFFQAHGSRPLRLNELTNETETIIHRYPVSKLQRLFIKELSRKSLIGYQESLHELCQELELKVEDLSASSDKYLRIYENKTFKLYYIRFDILFANFKNILSQILGKPIETSNTNLSDSKWYGAIYHEFKHTLKIPESIIIDLYQAKRDLIQVFYSTHVNQVLSELLIKYGEGDHSVSSGIQMLLNKLKS